MELLLSFQVYEKKPEYVKNFGIWLRYVSRSGIHNMYREYRDLTTASAVTQCCKSTISVYFYVGFNTNRSPNLKTSLFILMWRARLATWKYFQVF